MITVLTLNIGISENNPTVLQQVLAQTDDLEIKAQVQTIQFKN
jgi:hypothetical protein